MGNRDSVAAAEGSMRPKKHEMTGSGDLFRARLEQITNMRHELVQLAEKVDWDFLDGEIAPLYSDNGRPGIEARFVIGVEQVWSKAGTSRLSTVGLISITIAS